MKIVLICLAVWLIPIIITFYCVAFDLKREDNSEVTLEDVYDELEGGCTFLTCFPVVNIVFCIFVIGITILGAIKNIRIL